MMKKLVVLTILLSLCIQATAAIANTHNDAVDDDHNKTRSGTKATEAFCIENEVVTSFIQEEQYRDNDYSYTSIPKYRAIETDYRKDLPKPVIIKAPDRKDGDAFILETYCEGQLVRSDNFKIGEKSLEIWNLTPNKKYTYKLYLLSGKQKKEIASGAFRTEGQVRMLNIDGIDNCRDIGGWPLPNGQRVKYDQIFRSSELGWLLPHITEEGIYELLEVLEIEVEIDFGDFSYWSPVEDRIEFVHGTDYQILPYQDMLTKSGTQYKNCFEKLVNSLREGKKVLFHCTIGADRTGTFAFLLEGLLGVSESDLAKEYELTSFVYDERYRNIDYSWMMDDINKRFSGSTLNERIEKMALSFGISQKDIDDFRSLMTEKSICTTSADDTDMDFTILSYTNKTVQIGNGEESAIPQETPGVFEIPSTIQYYGSEYKIVSIGNCAFEDCNHLSSVKIPSGVTSIGEETFSGCSSLASVSIPNSVKSIDSGAFYNCSALTSVTIPDKLASISNYAFLNCSRLTSVTIPNNVTQIGESAFDGCSDLDHLSIPSSVNYIKKYAFSGCGALNDVYCYAENVPETEDKAFKDSNVENVILHVAAGSINEYKEKSPWNQFRAIIPLGAKKYTLTYKVDDEVHRTYDVYEGMPIEAEPEPTMEGYTFSGWSKIPNIMPAQNVTITGSFEKNVEIIKIGDSGKIWYCGKYDLDFTGVENLKAYTATGFDTKSNVLWLSRVYDVPAGTGIMLKGMKGEYNITHSKGHSFYTNMFKGDAYNDMTVSNQEGDYTNFFLNKSGVIVPFGDEIVTYPAGMCYLQIPNHLLADPANTRTIDYVFDDEGSTSNIYPTTIAKQKSDVYYNLKGQRVNNPTKGLYIKNGIKIVIE